MPRPRPEGNPDNDRPPKPGSRRGIPVWKKALFSLLTIAIFFGLAELVLLLFGVEPLSYEEDPYVGFATQIPLYIEAQAGGGQMETARNKRRFFNRQQFSRAKPDGVTRVFCLGGSTTYGRPYDDRTSFCGWLREMLPLVDGGKSWELINAGGISYASYRVAALMEELADYNPDLFIVYCGQNEFLERRTYAGIIEMPEAVRGIGAVLSKTRTYSGLARLVRGSRRPDSGQGRPAVLEGEVDAILDASVGPQDYKRDDPLKEQVLAHYRYNMARMVDIARAAGAEVVFVTPASNLRHCSPFKSEHRDGLPDAAKTEWDALWVAVEAAFAEGRFAEALAPLDAAAGIDDRYADLHFYRGEALVELGRFEEAKAAYWRAVDEDVCPLRALSPMREIVLEIAREREVPLVDFAALAEAASPGGIPGENLFLDHVHPTIEGHRMLAEALIDTMGAAGLLTVSEGWGQAASDRVAAGIMAEVDPKAQGVAMRNLSKVFSWAGKMEEAYRAARKALELFPGDAESHYQVGNLARHLGRTDEAIERLRHLVGVELGPEITFYVKAHAQLAEMLAEQGDLAGSGRVLDKLLKLAPDHPGARTQQTRILTARGQRLVEDGQFAAAAAMLSEAARLSPDSFEAHLHWGVALVRAGEHHAAIPVLRRLIELRPDYLPAYSNLSFVLAQLDRLDEAEAVCRQALAIAPDDEGTKRNLDLILKRRQ